jgi:hypothetical protein
VSTQPAYAPDAAMVLGIAATALPFARTPEDEAERWLRLLRLHGEVGAALQALGVSEVPINEHRGSAEHGHGSAADTADRDPVALVSEQAVRIAGERGADGVATTELLMAVMEVYGEDFDRVLSSHGTDRDEVLARLDVQAAPASDG